MKIELCNDLYLERNENLACLIFDRPERKNSLRFETYHALTDFFSALPKEKNIHSVVIYGEGGNFCSGGDVHDIITPLTTQPIPQLLEFTRLTSALVLSMRTCPQPIIAAIDGVCVGAGAMLALAADIRLGTRQSRTAYLFSKAGLAGCDMGACALLPRIIGQGRAAEVLYTGRTISGEEAYFWGLFNRLCEAESLVSQAQNFAKELANGPRFAHAITKNMLNQEWSMSLEQALEAEAKAQALCMASKDFVRAKDSFIKREKTKFQGN